jgi:hypothetical protein
MRESSGGTYFSAEAFGKHHVFPILQVLQRCLHSDK